MKYRILFLIFSAVFLSSCEEKKGIIRYGQAERAKLIPPMGPDFNAYLVFNENESYYTVAKDSLDKDTVFKTRYKNGQNIRTYPKNMTSRFGRQVYYNQEKDSIYWNQWVTFYVAEKTPKINWKLQKETKTISDYNVKKAIGTFRGRNYIAWYAEDIPLPYGPWKLQGLPGLILEAYDENKILYFYSKEIEYPTRNKTSISQVKRPNNQSKGWSTLDDFKKRVRFFVERSKNNAVNGIDRKASDIYTESFEE